MRWRRPENREQKRSNAAGHVATSDLEGFD